MTLINGWHLLLERLAGVYEEGARQPANFCSFQAFQNPRLPLNPNAMMKSFTRLLDPLYNRLFTVLSVLFGVGLVLLLFHTLNIQPHLIHSMAQSDAENYDQSLEQLQNLLSSDLVEQARNQDFYNALQLTMFLAALWVGGFGLIVSKLRRDSQELEQRVSERTAALQATAANLAQEMEERKQAEFDLLHTHTQLRRAHDELEERVKERTATLAQTNLELSNEIAERKQAEAAIRQLNQELVEQAAQLEASNKELEAFSYSVSHDLRAPLRGIDGFSQAVLEDYGPQLDETGKNYLQRVREASQRMSKLIDGMLNLARLTRMELQREAVDLSQLVVRISEDLQKQDTARQVEWVIGENIIVNADGVLIRDVLENLLGNAWKFTAHQPHARIEFGQTQQEGQPVYFIRDNGAGFDMTYVHKLFGAFQRLHAMSEYPGIGVGLATVHRIIQRHGGKIWAEGAVSAGATFYFTLTSREV